MGDHRPLTRGVGSAFKSVKWQVRHVVTRSMVPLPAVSVDLPNKPYQRAGGRAFVGKP